ncbi:hypothetical protein BBK36DRAFT_1184687 [Trichoderma citrinoviride]|uniref:Uncharacterized protein n=1 Tax=Trichoderma citrinoviride TaxID=58853 RepID=A0A2T4B022_9HYPO|nr:hypothetical protein BBK36DRAFT_1184687 [Trichoderma citrinoviride]PTB62662.1 hypothetical protein BBK36DRAFT_1184687 [Trichoderma citrinoviride]
MAIDEWPPLIADGLYSRQAELLTSTRSLASRLHLPSLPLQSTSELVCSATGTVLASTNIEKLKFKAAKASTRASPGRA